MESKKDFGTCDPNVIAVCLSLIPYTEDNVSDYICRFFPGFTFRIWAQYDGGLYYFLLMDDKTGRVYVIIRGTDGFSLKGRLNSWVTNFRAIKGKDGVHNGFQTYGNESFDNIKDYLCNYDYIYYGTHSQGSGIGQYQIRLCCENLNFKKGFCNFLGYPPTYNKVGVKVINKYIKRGKIECYLFCNEGDPVCSETFRKRNSIFSYGVDIAGEKITLPNIQKYDDGNDNFLERIIGFTNHSPSQYLAAYALWLGQENRSTNINDFHMLGETINWINN